VPKLLPSIVLFLIPHLAAATPVSVDLTVSNENLGLPAGTAYATVVWDVVGTTATFTIDVNNAVLTGGTNFGIQDFYLNTNIATLDAGDFTLPSGWGVFFSQQAGGFGAFDVNKGDAQGGGQNRYDPATFTITDAGINATSQFFFLSDLPAGNGQGHFAAHIAGFNELNGQTSAFFRDAGDTSPTPLISPTPVPEPASLVLSVFGLAALTFLRRRPADRAFPEIPVL
jgi:hypothetical protein